MREMVGVLWEILPLDFFSISYMTSETVCKTVPTR